MLIDAQQVHATVLTCLFREGEDVDEYVEAQGLMQTLGFHPGRLREVAPQIRAWLDALPPQFQVSGGGGWSFLNGCTDRDGSLWTGEQTVVDELLMLGIGIGYARILVPREMWSMFPGGVPYFSVGEEMKLPGEVGP